MLYPKSDYERVNERRARDGGRAMSHTPGPWEIHPALAEGANHVRICSGVEEVARVGSVDHPWTQTVKDARLIAQATAMLGALRDLMLLTNPLLTHDEQRLHEARKNAQDIIRKATGDEG